MVQLEISRVVLMSVRERVHGLSIPLDRCPVHHASDALDLDVSQEALAVPPFDE